MKKTEWLSINWGKGICVLILLALLVILAPAVPSFTPPVRVHPLLAEMAQANPDGMVNVIVQKAKAVKDTHVEDAVKRLGAIVTQDLWIINGFAAEIKARDVFQLAQIDGVRWVSWDAPVEKTDCADCTTTGLANAYVKTVNAHKVWPNKIQGQGIGVAVVDSGVNWQTDLYTIMGVNRVVANVAFHSGYNASTFDAYSHGTHIAGIVGGNGRSSNGKYIGVAPQVDLINVKVSDDLNLGRTTDKDVVEGLQWILQNKDTYNIRVVNISINGTVSESYNTNPLDAAVEVLWFNGIVVVVSAGNKGNNAVFPPANDPFVITVGATDDKGTATLSDDVMTSFSSFGKTIDGFNKPDLVAPGKDIVSLMGNSNQGLPKMYPDHIVTENGVKYFRMSGTSMSAPIVAGGAALLLQDERKLTPDQVKYRLKTTANKNWSGYNSTRAGAGYLDIYAAVNGTTTASSNTGLRVSNLLFTGTNKPAWGSVEWGSVEWGSVEWGSVEWGSVEWGSDYWGQ